MTILTETVLAGDCRDLMPKRGPFDMILADPPYGDTSLAWDRRVDGWIALARAALQPTGSLWVFGSLRHFMATADQFADAGFRLAQEIVWEKQNGSNFHADRFRRVHELAVQFYPAETPWRDIYNDVQTTPDATARSVRRKQRPPHTGHIDAGPYVSLDGGPRLMRSVIYVRNCHSRAIHPTEKPSALLEILIRTSCPQGGLVGDWFAGSGAAGEACRLSGRRYLGCEIDADMADMARARIAARMARRVIVCAGPLGLLRLADGQAGDAGHDEQAADDLGHAYALVEQPVRQCQHGKNLQVRCREGRADGRALEQGHPREKGADVAHEGAIDPGLAEHARQPGRGELQRQRRIAGLLEAQLGQRVEGHEHQKANEIKALHTGISVP